LGRRSLTVAIERWRVRDIWFWLAVERQDLLIVDACEATLRGWLGRIPLFVWSDLGLPVPGYLVE